jgi:flagellar motor switch protein FliM
MASDSQRSAEPASRPGSIAASYGLCKPGMLPPDQIAAASGIHESFARGLSQVLSEYLELPVAAALDGVSHEPLADFLSPAEDHACLITLDVEPMCGQAFIGFPPGFAFRILNTLLASPQNGFTTGRNSMTEIEIHIMRDCFGAMVRELQRAWAVLDVKFTVASITGGELPQLSPSAGTMLVLRTTVNLDGTEESFRIAIPGLLLRVASRNTTDAAASRLPPSNPDLLNSLRGATCQVEALLDGSTLRMSDLLAMEPGQILKLGQSAGASFKCTVNGKLKFAGELIHSGERQALQIQSIA